MSVRRHWIVLLLALIAAPVGITPLLADPPEASLALERGLAAYRDGRFEQAARDWREAAQGFPAGSAARTRATAQRGLALQALGRHGEAIEALREAAGAKADGCDSAIEPRLLDALGGAFLLAGAPQPARRCLELAQEAAQASGDRALLAVVLNNQGLLNEWQEQPEDALVAYRRSIALADAVRNPVVGAKARVNVALLMAAHDDLGDGLAGWRDALAQVERLPQAHDKLALLTALGGVAASALADAAHEVCGRAERLARQLGQRREAAAAIDCRAAHHERAGRTDDALRLAREALTLARRARAPDLEFVIEGRVARLLHARGREEEAIAAYRRALDTVEAMRADLVLAHRARHTSFREVVEPLYTGLADLLLTRARALEAKAAAPLLASTLEVLERLRAAELRDYFRDDCVDALRARKRGLERTSLTSAVFHTVVLSERTEVLVTFPDGDIIQHTVQVPRRALVDHALALRVAVSAPRATDYLTSAQKLDEWLVRGLEPTLRERGIDTLAFVPDGPLRGVPLAALHDGKRFLVERYAIATIPGRDLVEAQPLKLEGSHPLLAGVAGAVAGFPALPYVARELEQVHKIVGGSVLEEFTATGIERALRTQRHDIVHIASHGLFTGDVNRSFLVSAQGELTLARIQQLMRSAAYGPRPIELLVLSACETASGDERAALGMAGLAIQAGASSALATLWQVNDEATAALMKAFYTHLGQPGRSKAEALRRAQLELLAAPEERYRHPFFWAPFVLIGNWL